MVGNFSDGMPNDSATLGSKVCPVATSPFKLLAYKLKAWY